MIFHTHKWNKESIFFIIIYQLLFFLHFILDGPVYSSCYLVDDDFRVCTLDYPKVLPMLESKL